VQSKALLVAAEVVPSLGGNGSRGHSSRGLAEEACSPANQMNAAASCPGRWFELVTVGVSGPRVTHGSCSHLLFSSLLPVVLAGTLLWRSREAWPRKLSAAQTQVLRIACVLPSLPAA
jgi:hypothetical protein